MLRILHCLVIVLQLFAKLFPPNVSLVKTLFGKNFLAAMVFARIGPESENRVTQMGSHECVRYLHE